MALITRFVFPAGVGMDYAGGVAPLGWLLCHGQAVSRALYKPLFDAIGTTYGAGDGVTTFNLPDVRGRVRFAKDNMGGVAANRITSGGGGLNGAVLGAVGGAESVTLATAQMPNHSHGVEGNVLTATTGLNRSAGGGVGVSSSGAGSGQAHSNIPPSITFNYIISTGA